MRTKVKMSCNDNQHKEWIKGEEGYIDGYVRGGDGRPCLAVVIGSRIILCAPNQVEVIEY